MVVTAVGIEPGPPAYKLCLLTTTLLWLTGELTASPYLYYYLSVTFFLLSVYIGALVSMYQLLEYTINSNENKQKLTFNKTSNFCFAVCVCVLTLYHTITPSSMNNTDSTVNSPSAPMPDP